MSAALLQDNKKCNELEDDRESCLHVLTWRALCFTNHTIINGELRELLWHFDEVYEDDGVKGGSLKIGFLLSGKISQRVKFDGRPHLDELIANLTRMFAVRYEWLPSASDMEPMLFEGIINFRNTRMETLKKRDWLVETFRRHLDSGSWPTSDSAVKQSTDGRKSVGE
jgi:hypothetical protein